MIKIAELSEKSVESLMLYLKQVEPMKCGKLEAKGERRVILKFISVFHPDKQHSRQDCTDFLRVCEEATKSLTRHLRFY